MFFLKKGWRLRLMSGTWKSFIKTQEKYMLLYRNVKQIKTDFCHVGNFPRFWVIINLGLDPIQLIWIRNTGSIPDPILQRI